MDIYGKMTLKLWLSCLRQR